VGLLNLLAAINLVLRQSGQGQSNELSESSQDAALAKQAIIRARREILVSGFHFNTNIITLTASNVSTGGKRVAVDVATFLSVKFSESKHSHRFDPDLSTTYVWDMDAKTWETEAVADVEVVFDINNPNEAEDNFKILPELMAQWIAKRAAAEYWYETHQSISQTLEAKAERAKTRFQNSIPHRNIRSVTGFNSLALRGNASPTGTFDARTQSHILP
jgi:hypothetical protein